jgi:hypothetical protein
MQAPDIFVELTASRRDIGKPCLEDIMLPIETDSLGQPYIEWAQTDDDNPARFKRAWISRREPDKDWAGTGRYLNVVRIDHNRAGSGGAPTDFPIYCDLTDAQVLEAFVAGVCAATGCPLP